MPKPNQTQPNNQNQQNDSSQAYYIRASGVRKPTTIRIDTGLWEAFKKTLSEKGLSTCEILEHFILGVTVGLKTLENKCNTQPQQPTTINVNVEIPRFVRRVRRARVEYVDEGFGVERFYCALGDEHVPFESLPLVGCNGCPNGKCREFVFKQLGREFE